MYNMLLTYIPIPLFLVYTNYQKNEYGKLWQLKLYCIYEGMLNRLSRLKEILTWGWYFWPLLFLTAYN
jgi:hypothetical protein